MVPFDWTEFQILFCFHTPHCTTTETTDTMMIFIFSSSFPALIMVVVVFIVFPPLLQVMANLNFQQPPRIPSASLSRSTNSGFTGNSISGNVTPTSSLMFQSSQQQSVSNSSYVSAPGQQQQNQQQNQQQLSPNRGGQMAIGVNIAPSMGNRRMFNPSIQQRDDFNTRRMAGGLGGGSMNMGTFMPSGRYSQGGTGGINNFFASSSDTPPTLLDMSEFPSLTNARQNDQHSNVMQAPGSKPYGKISLVVTFV